MKIEIASFSLEAAILASDAGADRIELCSSFMAGGLTPGLTTIRKLKETVSIPVFVMIRPREGDFLYSAREFELMLDDTREAIQQGADGIVTGLLLENGLPDHFRIAKIMKAAGEVPFTFHRAFDLVPDPVSSLQVLMDCGISRVLTSGQQSTAPEGIELLLQLARLAHDSLLILPGGGINEDNLGVFLSAGCFNEVHLSAKKVIRSATGMNTSKVSLGSGSPEDNLIHMMPDPDMIRRIRERVKVST